MFLSVIYEYTAQFIQERVELRCGDQRQPQIFRLKFSGELTLEGKLDGEINTDGVLTLGENGVVNENMNVNSAVVRGKINGNVIAKDKIEIKAKDEVFGDIRAAKLVIEEEVAFMGKSEVNPNKVAPSAPSAHSTHSTPPRSPILDTPKPIEGISLAPRAAAP
ncbi:MAG: bactofilin family protein [Limisphaerales bacterium]